jgi:toxin ParE1/3/4
MKVRFTPTARSQFLAGLEYIQADNPLAAAALLARAKQSLRRLATYPQSGRKIPEFPELAHREVIVPPYRFFYRVEKPTVWIVAVWHGAQLPTSPQSGRRPTSR